ncbi:hypothetical protein [Caulifigura coniformis]|uniref:hypothetical protein n=1 Tax=Caulifigura coniformis TaxID=2527983 RepID=UPI0011A56727|nr:hypothetical protein [Caulifigura coniformis]
MESDLVTLNELLQIRADQDFTSVVEQLRRAREVFYEAVASRFEEPLQKHLRSLAQDSYEEKKTLARWINGELRNLGLAVKCPKTGLDSMLCVSRDRATSTGAFRLRPFVDNTRRTVSSVELFPMHLTPHFERIEPFADKWRSNLRDEDGQGERSR